MVPADWVPVFEESEEEAFSATVDFWAGFSAAGFSAGLLRGLVRLRGGRRRRLGGLAADRELQTGVDQRRVGTDGLAVVRVELLPATVDVLLVGDLRKVVTALHGVRPGIRVLLGAARGGLLGRRGNGLHGLLGNGVRGGGVGDGGTHQRERERGATGSGDGDGAGQAHGPGTAVLTLRGHGEFLSGACEVSCRVRAGDARPRRNAALPQAVPGTGTGSSTCGSPAPAVYGWSMSAGSGRRQD
ncbi:hypothetical protein SVIOM342S_08044 [Streptomyces violaceorubidus]